MNFRIVKVGGDGTRHGVVDHEFITPVVIPTAKMVERDADL